MNVTVYTWLNQVGYLVTAGICSILCIRTLNMFLIPRPETLRKIFLWTGSFLLTGMIIYIGDVANLPPTFFIFLIAVYLAYSDDLLPKVTVSFMLASIVFAFNALDDSFLMKFNNISFRLLFWICLYFFIKKFGPPKGYEISPALWKLLLMLTLTPLGIVFIVVLSESSFYSSLSTRTSDFLLLCLAFFSFAGLLQSIRVLAKQYQLEQHQILNEMNRKYYESIEEQQFEVRRLRHDMNNHLQTLSALSDDKRTAYLTELIDSPALNRTVFFCQSRTVNAVFNAKYSLIEENSIDFTWELFIPEEIVIEEIDLCALFANILDNAIEACIKLPPSHRKIKILARTDKGLLVVEAVNSTKNEMTASGILKTTKKDKQHHGYGMINIKEIVDRHQGSLEIKMEGGIFSVFLYLSLA